MLRRFSELILVGAVAQHEFPAYVHTSYFLIHIHYFLRCAFDNVKYSTFTGSSFNLFLYSAIT